MKGTESSDSNPSGIQGVCPTGWHIPSDSEWMELEMFLGMSSNEVKLLRGRGSDEGNKLKETQSYRWGYDPDATNTTGFTAVGGGARDERGFLGMGGSVYYWTSTEYLGSEYYNTLFERPIARALHSSSGGIERYPRTSKWGFKVRCVKD